jgi:ribonuclease P protein component
VERIKRRTDFLRAQKGRRQFAQSLTLELCPSPPGAAPDHCRVGFTATRRIGPAVKRNRAKRRLRAAASAVLPLLARKGHDYVLIAKTATLSRPYPALLADLSNALTAGHAALDAKPIDRRAGARKGNEIDHDPKS